MFACAPQVGILFQEGGLFDSLTIAENVAYPLLNQTPAGAPHRPRKRIARVRESLRFVELEHTLDKFPSELSGGMRRRVGIARAVVTAPPLVLYDSPTAGLDPITANTIITLILKERDLRNTATIMVTHRYQDGHLMANFRYNPTVAKIERGRRVSQLSHRFLVMQEGRLVFEGDRTATCAPAPIRTCKSSRVPGVLGIYAATDQKALGAAESRPAGDRRAGAPGVPHFPDDQLQRTVRRRARDVYTYLDDSAAIADGAPVRLNGITVGQGEQHRPVRLERTADRIVRVDMQVEQPLPAVEFPSIR